jgi:hypothetical protein
MGRAPGGRDIYRRTTDLGADAVMMHLRFEGGAGRCGGLAAGLAGAAAGSPGAVTGVPGMA